MTVWSSVSLVGVALLHSRKQNGEHSLSVDPLRDWRLEFYQRYRIKIFFGGQTELSQSTCTVWVSLLDMTARMNKIWPLNTLFNTQGTTISF